MNHHDIPVYERSYILRKIGEYMKWTGSRRLFSRFGLTLIEVLASVVILAVAGTAALFAVESIQAGQLKEAEYADALGLATTIAEEIKDRDPGSDPNQGQVILNVALQIIQNNLVTQLFNQNGFSVNRFITSLQTTVTNLFSAITILSISFPSASVEQQLLKQNPQAVQQLQGYVSSVSQMSPLTVLVPGDALGSVANNAQPYVLYVPSPAALGSDTQGNGSTYAEFLLWLARGGVNWTAPYSLMNGYTCQISVQGPSNPSSSSPSTWVYTVKVTSPHGAVASVNVPVIYDPSFG